MKDKNVEDVYRLSPMQRGMLFHSLYAPEAGEYVVQFAYTLEGRLDTAAFARAWQAVVDRHPILRTSFHWEGLAKSVQVVHRHLSVAFDERDWSALAPAEAVSSQPS